MLVKETTGQLRVLWAVCFEILHPSLSDHNNVHFKLNIAKPVSVWKEVFAANRNPWTKHNFLEIKLILSAYFASLKFFSINTILCLANFQISMILVVFLLILWPWWYERAPHGTQTKKAVFMKEAGAKSELSTEHMAYHNGWKQITNMLLESRPAVRWTILPGLIKSPNFTPTRHWLN